MGHYLPDEIAEMGRDEIERLWKASVEAEDTKARLAARAIIDKQLATMPEPDKNGEIDMSPAGAWARASGVVNLSGRRAHDLFDGEPFFMLPEPDPTPLRRIR